MEMNFQAKSWKRSFAPNSMLTSESLKSEIAILILYGDTNKRKTLDWLAAAELKGADLHQPGLRWLHIMINNPLDGQKSRANLLFRAQLSRLRAWPMSLIQFHEPLRLELFNCPLTFTNGLCYTKRAQSYFQLIPRTCFHHLTIQLLTHRSRRKLDAIKK
jgi:hypothetical protein